MQGLERDIQEDILGAVGGEDPKPVKLTFKGLKSMQDNNLKKTRVIYIDIVKDENYNVLQKIADTIIQKFIEK